MYPARPIFRRYRLRNKSRLMGSVVIAVLLAAGSVIALTLAQQGSETGLPALGEPMASLAAQFIAGTTAETSSRATADPAASPPAASPDDWRLILVNKDYPLPQDYRAQMRQLPNGLYFDARAFDDLTAMIHEGESQGLDFVICSAFRSVEKQQELFDAQLSVEMASGLSRDDAVKATATKVAPPGTSEHNLGLAADIVAYRYQKLDQGYCDTPEYVWLRDNAHRFGFIMRYPDGKSSVTGIIFEPWHFRYVGKEHAEAIHRSGLCLEEYLANLNP